jgi:hypothetical protein
MRSGQPAPVFDATAGDDVMPGPAVAEPVDSLASHFGAIDDDEFDLDGVDDPALAPPPGYPRR